MNEVYAVLLLYEAKREINEENIKRVLEAAGASVDENRIKALLAALEGVKIEEAIKQVSLPLQQPATEERREEKKEEESKKKEEEAIAGLASLFG